MTPLSFSLIPWDGNLYPHMSLLFQCFRNQLNRTELLLVLRNLSPLAFVAVLPNVWNTSGPILLFNSAIIGCITPTYLSDLSLGQFLQILIRRLFSVLKEHLQTSPIITITWIAILCLFDSSLDYKLCECRNHV